MIVLIEPVRHGVEHQPFNTSLLLACRAAFPQERIRFCAEPQHLAAVRQAIPADDAIDYQAIAIAPRRASDLARTVADGRALRHGLQADPKLLLFASVTTPLLWQIALLAKGGKNLPGLAGFLHGGLAGSLRRPRYNVLKRLTSLRAAMLAASPYMRLFVLEESIRDAVNSTVPELAGRLDVFPHPLPPDIRAPRPADSALDLPLKIGLLGLCTPQKGLFSFLGLAERLHDRLQGACEFHIVGRIHEDHVLRAAPYLRFLARRPAEAPLPRAEFLDAVDRLHYAAFFFDGDHYQTVASGVLLDCVALGIPLLGRRHPLLDGLARSTGGTIGHFCEPGAEERMLLELVRSASAESHNAERRDMLRLRQSRTPAELASRLRALADGAR